MRARSGSAWLTAALVASALVTGSACGDAEETPEDPVAPARDVIRDALNANDEWIRAEAYRLLGKVDDPELRQLVEQGLRDRSALAQGAAIEALLARGVQAAESAALGKLLRGDQSTRLGLLRLVLERGQPSLRAEAVQRIVLDPDPEMRLSALRLAADTGTRISTETLRRLADDTDVRVRSIALALLAEQSREDAFDRIVRGLLDEDPAARLRALDSARHVPRADLWPMLRSYAALGEPDQRQAALLALGHLGDASIEEDLRSLILTGDEALASEALRAIVHIPTDRARRQPAIHIEDPRREIRMAALNAMIAVDAPLPDFEPLLRDADREIVERTLRFLEMRDADRAASALARALNTAPSPEQLLRATFAIARATDEPTLVHAAGDRFEQLRRSQEPAIADLATRLVLMTSSPGAIARSVMESEREAPLYALLEAMLESDEAHPEIILGSLDHPLLAIRLASAINYWRDTRRFGAAPTLPEGDEAEESDEASEI